MRSLNELDVIQRPTGKGLLLVGVVWFSSRSFSLNVQPFRKKHHVGNRKEKKRSRLKQRKRQQRRPRRVLRGEGRSALYIIPLRTFRAFLMQKASQQSRTVRLGQRCINCTTDWLGMHAFVVDIYVKLVQTDRPLQKIQQRDSPPTDRPW